MGETTSLSLPGSRQLKPLAVWMPEFKRYVTNVLRRKKRA